MLLAKIMDLIERRKEVSRDYPGGCGIETRQPAKRVGIRISQDARKIELSENRIEGFATPVSGQAK